jgi:hypothetical protein
MEATSPRLRSATDMRKCLSGCFTVGLRHGRRNTGVPVKPANCRLCGYEEGGALRRREREQHRRRVTDLTARPGLIAGVAVWAPHVVRARLQRLW